MKTQITAFELKYMVAELQKLVDGRVNQVYQPKGLLLQFHKSSIGKFYLRIEANALWLVEDKQEMTGKIPGLCQALRKYVKGKKLVKIEQIGSERVIEMELKTEKETYYLIIELFANGNAILLDSDRKIIRALEEREWKDRTIKARQEYTLPPMKKNIFELAKEDIEGKDEKEIAVMGFGKLYAKEIIARGGGWKGYQSLMKSKAEAYVYKDEATPIKMEQFKDGEKCNTFSEAISKIWKEEKPAKVKETKVDKVQKQILMQEKVVEELEKKAAEEQRKGELLYEHYQEVKEKLEKARGPQKIIIDLE